MVESTLSALYETYRIQNVEIFLYYRNIENNEREIIFIIFIPPQNEKSLKVLFNL